MIRVGRSQLALYTVGVVCVAAGAVNLVGAVSSLREWVDVGARWMSAPVLVDLTLVPLAGAVGLALRRVLPRRWYRFVAAGLGVSFLVTLVALPFLAGVGKRADNATLLDRPYLTGWLVLVAVGWAGSALVLILGDRARQTPARTADPP